MDFIGYERAADRVWVPAGNTGSVDVLAGGALTRIDGFPTKEIERNGRKHLVGPSSIAFGDGFAYVGNPGDNSVCAVDEKTLTKKGCLILDDMPDALEYVAATREVWATTPNSRTIAVLDASAPAELAKKAIVTVAGAPECDAVDEAGGRYFTNLEDADLTIALDLRDHHLRATWKPECGEDGPKGLAFDASHGWLFVACADHVAMLDAAHDGRILSKVDTGDGVDAITWDSGLHRLFVGSAGAGKLSVVAVGADGALSVVRSVPTAPGARNAVVDRKGNAFLTDSAGGRILVLPPG
jgi:hypothetical protein